MLIFRYLLLGSGLCMASQAAVSLGPIFQDHAVLQCDKALPIWGRADPGEHVMVSFKGQEVGALTGPDGRWIAYLEPIAASADPAELVVAGKNVVTIQDVLVGEVWLASGQSNMEWPVAQARDAATEIAAAHFPLIRQIKVAHLVAGTPTEDAKTTGWQAAVPEFVGGFTAVGYFFARDLYHKLGVPIGIIDSSWGGTAIESWMSSLSLHRTSFFPIINARWLKEAANFPARQAKYPTELDAWTKAEAHAQLAHTRNPVPWPPPLVGPGTPYEPSGLFNAMIAPLQPCALRGILWYQGEANWRRPDEYAELFPAMIRSWRAGWGQGDVPFFFVQLANYLVSEDPTHRAWAWLREAQAQALLLQNTGMVSAIDIGDPREIHARNKQEVGRRLALIAKVQVYGIAADSSGPVFDHATREGVTLRIYFSHAGTGLISYNKPVQSLEIAGADRKFYPAAAKIERDTLLVAAPAVKAPVAVRYAWSNAPEANLYNGAGLPAPPFRSDTW